jgi:hypothetical protein
MGFFDNLLQKVGTAPRAAASPFLGPAKPPAGPLDLAIGDFATVYGERFAVVGLRVHQSDSHTSHHYCLKDATGGFAVLAADGARDPAFTLQRMMSTQVDWSSDVVVGVAEQPLRLFARGRMRLRAWGDSGNASGARHVEIRRLADASGDCVLVLEEYDGRKEVRLGETVFEGEMQFERNGRGDDAPAAPIDGADDFEDMREERIVRGSPRAAAKALEENVGLQHEPEQDGPAADPTAYDDDEWADAVDTKPVSVSTPRRQSHADRVVADADDEWETATQLVSKPKRDGK